MFSVSVIASHCHQILTRVCLVEVTSEKSSGITHTHICSNSATCCLCQEY